MRPFRALFRASQSAVYDARAALQCRRSNVAFGFSSVRSVRQPERISTSLEANVLALSRSDLRRAVTMPEAIELMKTAFAELSAGRAQAPLRATVEISEAPSVLLTMPGFVPAANSLGVKIVSVVGDNAMRGLPMIHAVVVLVDHVTGQPLGIMEGGYITSLRTGAVSGAATDLLARPDAATLVVIGAGVQGVTQAAAVCSVRPITRVIAVDARQEALDRYVQSFRRDWPEIDVALETTTDANAAVAQADVICTATTSRAPVFDDFHLRPGTHINAVGAFTPEMQEIPVETVVRATVIVDHLETALAEAGDLIKPLNAGLLNEGQIARELGQVSAGTAPRRVSRDEITLFKSVGNAVQDVVVARRAVDRAHELGIGTTLNLGA
jgi:ornithine cyclodeaminase/alanine dehydrogenase-like protein (mu-crystallin family)